MMPGNKPRFNHQQMMADYLSGATLRECGTKYGVSMQACHRIIKLKAPRIMHKPYIVPKHRRRIQLAINMRRKSA